MVSGLSEAQAPFDTGLGKESQLPPLFGWMKGTITFAPDLDLTEPADPDLAEYLEKIYGSDDPLA